MLTRENCLHFCKGLITVADKDYTFSVHDNKVLLLPTEEYDFRYHSKGLDWETFRKKWIVGKTLNNKMMKKEFHMYIDSAYIDTGEIYLYPRYILEQDKSEYSSNTDKVKRITFHSKEINTFVQDDFFATETYNMKSDFFAPRNFDVILFGIKCKINVINGQHKEFDSSQSVGIYSYISIIFEKEIEIRETIKYYEVMYRFLCFVNKRKNIYIPEVRIGNEDIHSSMGFLCSFDNYKETSFSLNNRYANISINGLHDKFPNLLEYIANPENFNIFYLPENDESHGLERYIYTTALYEDIFRKIIVPKYTSDFAMKGNDVVWKIKKTKNGFDIKVTLKEKIQFCVDNYWSELFTDNLEMEIGFHSEKQKGEYISGFSQRLKEIRDDIAHGKLRNGEYQYIRKDLKILEMFIYYLVLTQIGLDKERILISISSVFNLLVKYSLLNDFKKKDKS